MRIKNLRLLTLFDVPIELHPSSFLMLGFVTWWVATVVYPEQLRGQSSSTYLIMAIITGFAFFLSVVVHEIAHAVVARTYAVEVRNIVIMIFGGITQTRDVKEPWPELVLSLAGPAANAAIGFVLLGGWWLLGAGSSRPLDHVLYWLAVTNLIIAGFNLIPAFPMDGGRVLRAMLWLFTGSFHSATTFSAWLGRGFGWILIAVGILTAFQVRGFLVHDTPVAISSGVISVLIGIFLEDVARRALLQTRVLQALEKYLAIDLMLARPPVVAPDDLLGPLAREVLELNPRVVYFVEEQGWLTGILGSWQIREVPERKWDEVTAGEAMVPAAKLHAIRPDSTVADALKEMEHLDLTPVPVVSDGEVLGVLGRDRILGVLYQKGFLRTARVG